MDTKEKNRLLALYRAQRLEEKPDGVIILYKEKDDQVILVTTWGVRSSYFTPSSSQPDYYSIFADRVLIVNKTSESSTVYFSRNNYVEGEVLELTTPSGSKFIVCGKYIIFSFEVFVEFNSVNDPLNAVVKKLDFTYLSEDACLIISNSKAIFVAGKIQHSFRLLGDDICVNVLPIHENIVAITLDNERLVIIINGICSPVIKGYRKENPVSFTEDGILTIYSIYGTQLRVTDCNLDNPIPSATQHIIDFLEVSAIWQYPDDEPTAIEDVTPVAEPATP